ncbi:MAG: alpha/beta fold hydrolase [Actinobacteria bacterium]|nr:alpha/beta fold hydrolase [Actinomycetota bacterium]
MAELIRPSTVLPATRTPISFLTSDGLRLIGEVAKPSSGDLSIGLLCLHPLPTHGGMMDSHLFKKAANRLPEMAGITVVRFNTRGTESEQGKSEGSFGNAITEKEDVIAAINYCFEVVGVKSLWVVGWSFGTDLALKFARDPRVKGLILLSPPLRFSTAEDLEFWSQDSRPVIALVPEFDDFLKPDEARLRFAPLKQIEIIAVQDAKHLWVGEPFVYRVLSEIVKVLNPAKLPLPTEY